MQVYVVVITQDGEELAVAESEILADALEDAEQQVPSRYNLDDCNVTWSREDR